MIPVQDGRHGHECATLIGQILTLDNDRMEQSRASCILMFTLFMLS